jgi:ribosomal protein S18 acetylase RimI-like enzyme
VWRVRPYTLDDLEQLRAIQAACFPPPFPESLWWSREQLAAHVAVFPEGALCAVGPGGILAGSATALVVRFDPAHPHHTWAGISDHGFIRSHDPAGDTLYGIDVAVRPEHRGCGVARALYEARFALVRRLGLRRFLAGSRLSGYGAHADRLSPEAYAAAVVAGRLCDPVVTPQLHLGLRPGPVIRGYLADEESRDCALLMEWTP